MIKLSGVSELILKAKQTRNNERVPDSKLYQIFRTESVPSQHDQYKTDSSTVFLAKTTDFSELIRSENHQESYFPFQIFL